MLGRSIWVAIVLLYSASSSVSPDDSELIGADPVVTDPVAIFSDEYGSCPELPFGVEPLSYTTLKIQLASLSENLGAVRPIGGKDGNEQDRVFNVGVYGRQLIETEEAYLEIFGEPSGGMDWEVSRVLVVEQFTSYKFGELDSMVGLSGIYVLNDRIIVSEQGSHYGPCQGIAQDPAWFSFDISYHLVVLPRQPELIEYHFCSVGGCPPDIP